MLLGLLQQILWKRHPSHHVLLTASVLPYHLHTQVGFDDLWVFFHFLWCALGDFFSQIEDHDTFRNIHHDTHVMLNEYDGTPPLLVHIKDEAGHVLFLFDIHAAHGFV